MNQPNEQTWQQALELVKQHERILVIPHANVDPDGLSSALACYQMFLALGKEVTVICPDTPPESLKFLPDYEKLVTHIEQDQDFIITINLQAGLEIDTLHYAVEDQKVNIIIHPKHGQIRPENIQLQQAGSQYDLIVVVDTANLELLGSFYKENQNLFTSVPIVNIDHHQSNTLFGHLNLIDTESASATEVLYRWFKANDETKNHFNANLATLILTGLITDTRSFQNPNTTPRSLEIAAELLDYGANQQHIIQNIYKTKPLSTLQVWGRALSHIQIDTEAKLVWSTISKEDLLEFNANSKDTHGILDELISTIPNADIHALFTEIEEGGFKASLRGAEAINVSDIAGKLFGGGGHPRAAGFKVKANGNFNLQVLEAVQRLKQELLGQNTNGVAKPQPIPQFEAIKNAESSAQPIAVTPQAIELLPKKTSSQVEPSPHQVQTTTSLNPPEVQPNLNQQGVQNPLPTSSQTPLFSNFGSLIQNQPSPNLPPPVANIPQPASQIDILNQLNQNT